MNKDLFAKENLVLGHPATLFVVFFTEMWERFSFYGMRVLLVNFLTMTLIGYNPGWEWSAENAGALFGTYAMLLYITPIAGGMLADRYLGYRWAVVIGSLIMTLGHASMALETEFSLYAGLALLVIGTGFFKPNMTSIVSEMYKKLPEKKDGAYTIFYMGVNAGAFFGMMLCGYMAEKVGWAWGFGLAGIFMLLGTLQFWLAKPLFGNIGDRPTKESRAAKQTVALEEDPKVAKRNPFTVIDYILIAVCTVIGLAYAINDPLSNIAGVDLFKFMEIKLSEGVFKGQYLGILIALGLFLVLVISRIVRYTAVVRDRMIAFIIFAFFTVFFWMAFEQGATSLVIFARDNINRELVGNSAIIYNIINALLTVVPLLIITYVLFLLWKTTGKDVPSTNIVLVICFLGLWAVAGWMLYRDFNTTAYELTYKAYKKPEIDKKTNAPKKDDKGNIVYGSKPITENTDTSKLEGGEMVVQTVIVGEAFLMLKPGEQVAMINKDKDATSFGILDKAAIERNRARAKEKNKDNGIVTATVKQVKANWVEITVSWFSILNSFFIIAFASLFTKIWDSRYNPSASVKYGLGLIVMALGFGLLAMGSYGIVGSASKVSMIWLILAYLFHTLGELCLSPVGLSYVSKLVPGRMIAFMFGMWYLAIAIGNKLAAILGGQIEKITESYSLSTFFLIFTIVPMVAGLLVILLNPLIKKLMHGVK
jgi:POT family proton-dependent oligopeptide transporter